jgi:uncharacterized protein YdeI (YjbR/CyaY-like superfamily)
MKPQFFESPAEWNAWLRDHHAKATEVLVGFHKTKSGKPSLTWPQSVDEALCYGWIDGVRRSLGETSYTIRFTPRKASSNWSTVNINRVKELTAEKRMKPAGVRAWELRSEARLSRYSYEQRKDVELDAAAVKAFRAKAAAWKYFEGEAPSYRTAAIHWVMTAKKEETRAKRLAILLESSAAGLRIPMMRWSGGKKQP